MECSISIVQVDPAHPTGPARRPREATLLELVWSVCGAQDGPQEVVAAVIGELESGRVCLCGNFRGVPISSLTSGLFEGSR